MGASQILDAIISEARRDAEAMIADAEQTADNAVKTAKQEADLRADALVNEARRDAESAAARDMLTAQLEARKASLKSRRTLLDDTFSKAVDQLCAIGKKDYIDLITRLVVDAAETGGEQLQVPSSDRDRYTGAYKDGRTMLQVLNAALEKAGKPGKLTLADEDGAFCGGVRLIGAEADIDCSFQSLVDGYRDANEAGVSHLLFGQEG